MIYLRHLLLDERGQSTILCFPALDHVSYCRAFYICRPVSPLWLTRGRLASLAIARYQVGATGAIKLSMTDWPTVSVTLGPHGRVALAQPHRKKRLLVPVDAQQLRWRGEL